MRITITLLLFTLCGSLFAMPIVTDAIVGEVLQAEVSETRYVAGHYVGHDETDTINHLTVWNIETPGFPQKGCTISEFYYVDYYAYTKFKVWQNYLIYTYHWGLTIVDIDNIYSPTQVYRIPINGIYSFEIIDHYLIIGWQDGSLKVYDISTPANPLYMSSFDAEVSVWKMWSTGNKLLVSCGHYSYNTLKGYSLDDGILTEICSLETGEQVSYAGISCGKLMYKNLQKVMKTYNYQNLSQPVFLHSYPAHANIICGTNRLASMDGHSRIKILSYSEDDGLTEEMFYDLSHLRATTNNLFYFKNGRLYFELAQSLFFILDLRDVSEEPSLIGNYQDGRSYETVKVSKTANRVYTQNNSQMRCFDINQDYTLSVAEFFAPFETVYATEMKDDYIYYQCSSPGSSSHLKSVNVTSPDEPVLLSYTPIDNKGFLRVSGSSLYSGNNSHLEKYTIGDDGTPQWQKQLSHAVQAGQTDYQVHFYDIVCMGDMDYGVGIFGGILEGYYPILVCWRPNGTAEAHFLTRYCRRLEVLDNYLYLITKGIDVYYVGANGSPIFVDNFYNHSIYNQAEYSSLVNDRYLYVSFSLTNSIGCFDLINRTNPTLINTVRHSTLSHEFTFNKNILITALGDYGISQHIQPNLTNIQDELIPTARILDTYPNPFSDRLTIDFTLDKEAVNKLLISAKYFLTKYGYLLL